MRFLLDTHLLIWSAEWADPRSAGSPLSAEAVDLIGSLGNEPMFSPVSIWEVAIKHDLRRPDFGLDPSLLRRMLLDNGYEELPVTSRHAVAVVGLPAIHKDPFDRLLIAQAAAEGVTLLTSDQTLARYPGPIRKV